MGLAILAALMEVNPPTNGPDIFQVFGMIGGLLGIVALFTLPWTVKKLRAETRSIEVTAEVGVSSIALNHLKAALEEADKTITRIKADAEHKIATLEQQVDRLIKTLEAERARSEEERNLHEQRVVQLLYDLRAKDAEIASLKSTKGSV